MHEMCGIVFVRVHQTEKRLERRRREQMNERKREKNPNDAQMSILIVAK